MGNIFKGFSVSVTIDQTSETVALTALSWISSLFVPDMVQKPWNRHIDFVTFMKRNRPDKDIHLFHLKDARFGCVSRSASITLYHWYDFEAYLANDPVTNKLACLLRDARLLENIPVLLATVAAASFSLLRENQR